MLTEPSIKVVPAGRCSSTIRKSRSHSGVLAGTLRCAVIATWALPPERDLAGDVLERFGIDGDAESGRQHLAVELGRRRIVDAPRDAGDAVGRVSGRP